jgi:acetylornithine/N-succinyldiaminopimelate aminotransferase
MNDLKAIDKQYVANTYARFPVALLSGKGSLAYDENGKEYVDLGSGIGVTSFGFGDDEWKAAVVEQLGKLQHTSNLYYTEPCVKLAEMLCERTGMKKVFFGNSGAEANEGMIKAARKYGAEHKGPEYYTIVTLENSFHGRTLGTLAATGQAHYHELFQPLPAGFVHAPANDLDAVKKAAIENKACAVMIECIQGEGGVVPLTEEFVKGVASFCAENDVLLCVDEVQTGNGRTGQLYAYMNYGVQPDIVSTAKGIAGGLPLGAVLFGEKTEFTLGAGDHGSTFGGNPVSCAAACSILSRIDDALLADVRKKSAYIFAELSGAPGVEAVTGMGLMIGVKTVKPAADVVKACMENGVLCLTAKDKVRLLPALNIPMDVLARAIAVVKDACA